MTELIPLGIAIVTVAAARRVLQSVTATVITCPTDACHAADEDDDTEEN